MTLDQELRHRRRPSLKAVVISGSGRDGPDTVKRKEIARKIVNKINNDPRLNKDKVTTRTAIRYVTEKAKEESWLKKLGKDIAIVVVSDGIKAILRKQGTLNSTTETIVDLLVPAIVNALVEYIEWKRKEGQKKKVKGGQQEEFGNERSPPPPRVQYQFQPTPTLQTAAAPVVKKVITPSMPSSISAPASSNISSELTDILRQIQASV